jgi:hypothetical protein
MNWTDVLVWFGMIAFVALIIGLGTWCQLLITWKVGGWSINRYKALTPESRGKLADSIRHIPGGRRFLKRANWDGEQSDHGIGR